jgi:SAM-dependent methyltransferase
MVYEKIKNIVKKIIPRKLLIDQEQNLRKLIFVFYKGNSYQCPVCEKKISAFIQIKVGDKLCPYCGSAARDRRLWTLLQPMLNNDIKVLDFSPPRCLYRKMQKKTKIEYTPTDFAGEFLASRNLDITQLELENNSYGLIVCYHVLEHVEADIQAMRELFRVLKPNGSCFIQTPFKEGDIYEDYTIKDPIGRKKHFEQEDHVRIYSVEGLAQRLASVGFKVERMDFSEKENNYYGFRQHETVLVAKK